MISYPWKIYYCVNRVQVYSINRPVEKNDPQRKQRKPALQEIRRWQKAKQRQIRNAKTMQRTGCFCLFPLFFNCVQEKKSNKKGQTFFCCFFALFWFFLCLLLLLLFYMCFVAIPFFGSLFDIFFSTGIWYRIRIKWIKITVFTSLLLIGILEPGGGLL